MTGDLSDFTGAGARGGDHDSGSLALKGFDRVVHGQLHEILRSDGDHCSCDVLLLHGTVTHGDGSFKHFGVGGEDDCEIGGGGDGLRHIADTGDFKRGTARNRDSEGSVDIADDAVGAASLFYDGRSDYGQAALVNYRTRAGKVLGRGSGSGKQESTPPIAAGQRELISKRK